jgi:hypothetical protein
MAGLKFGFCLGSTEDWFETGSLHHVSLDLELASHEERLGLRGSFYELLEIAVGENKCD